MNKPLIIIGAVIMTLGLIILGIGFIIGMIGASDQEYEEVSNEEDFLKAMDGTYRLSFTPSTIDTVKIEIASRGPSALIFDIEAKTTIGDILLSERQMITPYTREFEPTTTGIVSIVIDFEEEDVNVTDFSVKIFEMTLSDSAVGVCCVGTLLPLMGGLMAFVGLIMLIAGFTVGNKKMEDPWNKPQDVDTAPQIPVVPQYMPQNPVPPVQPPIPPPVYPEYPPQGPIQTTQTPGPQPVAPQYSMQTSAQPAEPPGPPAGNALGQSPSILPPPPGQ